MFVNTKTYFHNFYKFVTSFKKENNFEEFEMFVTFSLIDQFTSAIQK